MAIYLSQHGRSAPKEVDPERGLTSEGRAEVERVAKTLADAGISVDVILHSGKARAAQTADVLAAMLKPKEGVQPRKGIDPLDDVRSLADALPTDGDEMYVGHLPFMERLISYLITGDADRRVVTFQNGGVVRLDWEAEAKRWVIGWTLFPNL
jgi:phosphohistidine phosphatase